MIYKKDKGEIRDGNWDGLERNKEEKKILEGERL